MMQDEVNKIVFNALNVLPGALPFSSPSSGAFP